MPKPTKGPRLGGSSSHQRHILANLAKSLIEHRTIVTTEAKARQLKPMFDKLVTKARRGTMHDRRQAYRVLANKTSWRESGFDPVYVLFDEIAPLIDPERKGGYTRAIKLAPRRGDNAPMVQVSLVLEKVEKKAKASKPKPAAEKPKKAAAEAEEAKAEEAKAEEAAAEEAKAEEAEAEEAKAEEAAEAAEETSEEKAEEKADEKADEK